MIGPIGVFRGGEREVVGTGSLLDVREDQRSMAIAISSLGPPPSLPILALAADLDGRWTPPPRKRQQKTVISVTTVTPTRNPLTQAVSSVTVTVTVG
jgi:hypothetical protein